MSRNVGSSDCVSAEALSTFRELRMTRAVLTSNTVVQWLGCIATNVERHLLLASFRFSHVYNCS